MKNISQKKSAEKLAAITWDAIAVLFTIPRLVITESSSSPMRPCSLQVSVRVILALKVSGVLESDSKMLKNRRQLAIIRSCYSLR